MSDDHLVTDHAPDQDGGWDEETEIAQARSLTRAVLVIVAAGLLVFAGLVTYLIVTAEGEDVVCGPGAERIEDCEPVTRPGGGGPARGR